MVRWMSETIACALLTLRSSSEPVSCVRLGKGGGGSPGALDANVRGWFDFYLKSLTLRNSGQLSIIIQRQAAEK